MAHAKKGLEIEKPEPFYKKPLKFDAVPIFLGLVKGIGHVATGNLNDIGADVAEVVSGLGLESSEGTTAFLLIKRALFLAALDLTKESLNHIQIAKVVNENLSTSLMSKLENINIVLQRDFLKNPAGMAFLDEIIPLYEQWLVDIGTQPLAASLIARRLRTYFVYSLSAEWRSNHSSYKDLVDAIDSPFGAAEDRERDWENYFAALVRRTDENIFDEPFGLAEIYVPLHAYVVERGGDGNALKLDANKDKDRISRVIDLEAELLSWVKARKRESAVRVISGGPGSGKSSFTKMFCARLANERIARPLYVPLHLIDPTRDITEEIGRFVKDEGFIRFNPLETEHQVDDLILVFDGLDELASQGKVAAQVAKDFIHAVERMVGTRNLGSNPLLVLISGREIIIQENSAEFRKDRQILTVLPYFVSADEHQQYSDPSKILDIDLRNSWWKKYGALTGRNFDGLPSELEQREIDEITAQPLLNYLVALSYTRGKLDFKKALNLNSIYADLVTAVYERAYENNRIHRAISHISQRDFLRVMEEIGLAAWHGSDGRSTSVNEILAHCKESGLESLMETFQEGAKAGVTKLLAAFFFRQGGQHASGDATFVFTHKSFGEYLTAIRITRGIERMIIQLRRRDIDPDDGYDISQGLIHWAKLVGPAQMTHYVLRFLQTEITQISTTTLEAWHEKLTLLLEYVIEKQIPMERVGAFSYAEAMRRNSNACESLVVALNSCAQAIERKISINFKSRTSFGTFLRRTAPQRTGPENAILLSVLSYFDFSGQNLDMCDLYGANLRNTTWKNVALHYANLGNANLSGATFVECRMTEIDLSGARLIEAVVHSSDIRGAKLRNSNLRKVDLKGSILAFSDLDETNLEGALMNNVNVKGVDFSNARNVPDLGQTTDNGDHHVRRKPPTAFQKEQPSADVKRKLKKLRP